MQVYQMVRRHIETHPDFDRLPITWVSATGTWGQGWWCLGGRATC